MLLILALLILDMNRPHPLTPVLIETHAEETSARFQSLLPNLGEGEPDSYSPRPMLGEGLGVRAELLILNRSTPLACVLL
jgi:hypothetical protein